MADHVEGLYLVPEHMHDSIVLWIERAEPRPQLMGSFLLKLLSNDLIGAFAHADEENARWMARWVSFLYNFAPSTCFGSPKKVQGWYDKHHAVDDGDGDGGAGP